MPRPALFLGLIAFALAAGASPKSPPAPPKDTLPEKLALDDIPLGLGPRPVPKDSPLTEERVRLGRRLFFDPILSGDNTVACASCHDPAHGFAGSEARARGIRGQLSERRAPSLLNRAYGTAFFWDGRESTLEGQALRPIEDKKEMGSTVPAALERLRADETYKKQFEAAFPDGVTADNLARALASFERVLLRGDSRVDRFRRNGDAKALTPEERQGLWLYESKGRCWRCHSGANFTDEAYHNTGVSWANVVADRGRYALTKKDGDQGKFKTPTLRGVGLTGPYMHDGSMRTLKEVVQYYNRGASPNPHLDPALGPLGLSDQEVDDLVAFLKAL
jgi:cytochrome c peroxidase